VRDGREQSAHEATTSTSGELISGRVIEGRYRLDSPLGEGGLGVVWRGTQLRLGKPVAIKLMLQEHVQRDALRARFEREAKSLAALSHPNIVDVIDVGVDGDQPFIVMELLEGRSLDHAIDKGIEPERALAIGRDILRALAHAHGQGIVHRDLKPANVFLQSIADGSEIVRVLDFGLAKFVGERAGGPQLTQNGMVIGTPAYMAPEQATGGQSDARADVYSFAMLLFEMITGRRPFDGSGGELVRQHLLVAMPSLESVRPDLEVADELESLMQRAASKSPPGRFASARELMEAMFALPSPAVRARPGVASPRKRELAATSGGGREGTTSAGGRGASGSAARETGPAATAATMIADISDIDSTLRSDSRLAAEARASHASATVPTTSERSGGVRTAGAIPSAIAGHPSHATPPPPGSTSRSTGSRAARGGPGRRSSSVVAVLGGIGLLAAVGIGLALVWQIAASGEPVETVPAAPAEVPAATVADTAEVPAVLPDPDPWVGPLAERFAPIRRRLIENGRLGAGDQRLLHTMRRQGERNDPRPSILLGRAELAQGHRPDAVEAYENALAGDERLVRGDPQSVHDLVELAAHRSTSARACALLERHWGSRAVPAIDAELAEIDDDDDIERLQDLRERLVAGSTTHR
jgi:serine/threonine protein kinase